MNKEKSSKWAISSRRGFMKQMSLGSAGLALGSLVMTGCASKLIISQVKTRPSVKSGNRTVSFVTGTDQREASYQALKPLEREIESAI